MGCNNCTPLCCEQGDRNELVDDDLDSVFNGRVKSARFEELSLIYEGSPRSKPGNPAFFDLFNEQWHSDNSVAVIKIQARLRSFLQRKKYQKNFVELMELSKKNASIRLENYFTKAEQDETLQVKKSHKGLKTQEGQEYKYICNGAIYTGQWLGGMRHGSGTILYSDGATYTGKWAYNEPTKEGKFQFPNGDTYEGSWAMNHFCGYGILKQQEGQSYCGRWRCGMQHGKGHETWKDGSEYLGEFIDGCKEGRGIYIWQDKSKYAGQWHNNMIHGLGTHEWSDGRSYIGQWKNKQMSGFGKYAWKDGRSYEGQYLNDRKHGYGVHRWPDGRTYSGYWKDGKQHGYGQFTVSTQDGIQKRYGFWVEGNRQKWFKIKPNEDLNQQLGQIERKHKRSLSISTSNETLMTVCQNDFTPLLSQGRNPLSTQRMTPLVQSQYLQTLQEVDTPALDKPTFGPPNLFDQRMANIIYEAELIYMSLSENRSKGISKESNENIDSIEVSAKRTLQTKSPPKSFQQA